MGKQPFAHTEISLAQPAVGFHRFPLGLYHFDHELRVIAVDREHADLLGTRLLSVSDRKITDIMERIQPLLSDDFGNPKEIYHTGPAFLTIPELLAGLQIVAKNAPIQYVFEDDGGNRKQAAVPGIMVLV
ncbi:MAG TPA: hypothetical protein VI958_10535 [Acidobacteriota bacterium]